ncbi:MAG: antifreeze protein [Yoonia sp.]|nr:antifreeze protein [Yoonia sp.]
MTPIQFFAFNSEVTKLMSDTHAVMAVRLLGMAGALPAEADENDRMLAEKGPAFAQAMSEMTAATMTGKPLGEIMSAGMAPLQSEVSSNRERLTR